MGLPDGEKILRIYITVYTQYRRVTDKWTDGQTSCHGIVHAMHMCRSVKIKEMNDCFVFVVFSLKVLTASIILIAINSLTLVNALIYTANYCDV